MISGSLGNSHKSDCGEFCFKRKSYVTFERCVSFECFKTNYHKLKLVQVMSNFRKYCTETAIAAIM